MDPNSSAIDVDVPVSPSSSSFSSSALDSPVFPPPVSSCLSSLSRASASRRASYPLRHLADIELHYGSAVLYCHRLVLLDRSLVFDAMFRAVDCKDTAIPQQVTPSGAIISEAEFECLFDLLYLPIGFLTQTILQRDWTDLQVESLLHLCHYFGLERESCLFFLPSVQRCPQELKTLFWKIIFWAESNRVTLLLPELIAHAGRFHRFYEVDSYLDAAKEADRERTKRRQMLSPQTQHELLRAQNISLKEQLSEMQEYYEAGWNGRMYTVRTLFGQSNPSKHDIFNDLKEKIENIAKLPI